MFLSNPSQTAECEHSDDEGSKVPVGKTVRAYDGNDSLDARMDRSTAFHPDVVARQLPCQRRLKYGQSKVQQGSLYWLHNHS